MTERTFDVRPVYVDYLCDACKAGVMMRDGNEAPSLSGKRLGYSHICSNCHDTQEYNISYPLLRWVPIVPETDTGTPIPWRPAPTAQ